MVKRWVHPDEWEIPADWSPDDDIVESRPDEIAEYWSPIVEAAKHGDTDAIRRLFEQLIAFLRGDLFENAVYYSPTCRKVLADRLGVGLAVKSKEVGKAIGLGLQQQKKGPRKRKMYADLRARFIEWGVLRMRDLGLTSKESLSFEDAKAWVQDNAKGVEQRVSEDTIRNWTQDVRKRLHVAEVFSDVPVFPDQSGN